MKRLASVVLAFYRREPARCNTAAAAALSWLVLRLGLDVDDATILLAASTVLSLAAGELTRALVVPTYDHFDGPWPDDDPNEWELRSDGWHRIDKPWQPGNPDVRKPGQ